MELGSKQRQGRYFTQVNIFIFSILLPIQIFIFLSKKANRPPNLRGIVLPIFFKHSYGIFYLSFKYHLEKTNLFLANVFVKLISKIMWRWLYSVCNIFLFSPWKCFMLLKVHLYFRGNSSNPSKSVERNFVRSQQRDPFS